MSKQHLKARTTARKAKAAKRTEKALQLLESGKGVVAVARELGIHRKTLWQNLKQLNDRQNEANALTIEQLRVRQHDELRTMMDFVLNSPEMSDAEVAANFRLYAADIAKLMGLNSEQRHLVAKVDVTDPEKLQGYRRFVQETMTLTNEQIERVYAFARSLKAPAPINLSLRAGRKEGGNDGGTCT